jgi:hypothetical protein
MRYSPSDQIREIFELQEKAKKKTEDAQIDLRAATELINEFKSEIGTKFIYKGRLYEFHHSAMGFGGNHDWILPLENILVIV